MLATDIPDEYCLAGWVSYVAASGTFVKDASATIPTGVSGIPNGWTVINWNDESYANVLDIVLANKQDDSLTIVPNDEWSASAYPASDWEPVGVVVIPGAHGYIKDGEGTTNQCAMISLKPMSYSTPETGATSEVSMCWGGYGTDISGKSDGLGRYDSYSSNGLLNYNKLVVTPSGNIKETSELSSSSSAYLPRQASVNGNV